MINHLTPEQISKCQIGNGALEEERHARECPECGKELAVFQDALSQFRSSVVSWADRESPRKIPDTVSLLRVSRQMRMRWLRWLPVAAALAAIVVLPAYRKSIERRREAAAEVQESVLDEELLKRVNAHLSQTAPVSLQPLTELVSSANHTESGGER